VTGVATFKIMQVGQQVLATAMPMAQKTVPQAKGEELGVGRAGDSAGTQHVDPRNQQSVRLGLQAAPNCLDLG
jgi:hypothetical protein